MHNAPISATNGSSHLVSVHLFSAPVSIHQTRHSREIASATRVLAVDETGSLSWDDANQRARMLRGRFHCEGNAK
jgi:hypothetical protein